MQFEGFFYINSKKFNKINSFCIKRAVQGSKHFTCHEKTLLFTSLDVDCLKLRTFHILSKFIIIVITYELSNNIQFQHYQSLQKFLKRNFHFFITGGVFSVWVDDIYGRML